MARMLFAVALALALFFSTAAEAQYIRGPRGGLLHPLKEWTKALGLIALFVTCSSNQHRVRYLARG
jgi:hypothetical protein